MLGLVVEGVGLINLRAVLVLDLERRSTASLCAPRSSASRSYADYLLFTAEHQTKTKERGFRAHGPYTQKPTARPTFRAFQGKANVAY